MASQGDDVPNDFDGDLFSQQVDDNDNNYVQRREIVDSIPWPRWTSRLVQRHKHELHRVAVGPPQQDKTTVGNALKNVMNGMQGGIYVKIYNFNKTWKMPPDNWSSPVNLRRDEALQERIAHQLNIAVNAESIDIESQDEDYEEDENSMDILNEKEENEGSGSVEGIASNLSELLSFN